MRTLLVLTLLGETTAQIFRLPDPSACKNRKFNHIKTLLKARDLGVTHVRKFGKAYHFSWLEVGKNTKWDWEGARNYCREFCMDSVSIESVEENDWVRWRILYCTVLSKTSIDQLGDPGA